MIFRIFVEQKSIEEFQIIQAAIQLLESSIICEATTGHSL